MGVVVGQVRLVIQLGVTLPAELAQDAHSLGAGPLMLMTAVLFACSLISFGIGAPTGCPLPSPPLPSPGERGCEEE